jgi:hypothetical protein
VVEQDDSHPGCESSTLIVGTCELVFDRADADALIERNLDLYDRCTGARNVPWEPWSILVNRLSRQVSQKPARDGNLLGRSGVSELWIAARGLYAPVSSPRC